MGRQTTRLTLDNLAELPGDCASCVAWELDPVRSTRVCGREREEKAARLSEVLREWGSCGRVALVDDQPVGHVLFAPAVFLPGAGRFATAPVSQDAVLLATGYVEPGHRGGGLGRVLIQAMARDLIRMGGIAAVEAFGAMRPRAGDCVLPVDFLLAVGFRTHRPHAAYPRMRMDLRTTLTWREELETALDRLRGVVSVPAARPASKPVSRVSRSGRARRPATR